MTAPHAYIPKMRINKFKQILDLPQTDKFRVELFDTSINMTIHQDKGNQKVFIFHSASQVYGWTTDSTDAFTAKDNACIYTANELYRLMRGKRI